MAQNNSWQVHQYLAEQMDSRLPLLRRTPKTILLHGADGDCSRRLLAARYPDARLAEYDFRADALVDAAAARQQHSGWLAKWMHRQNAVPQTRLPLADKLPEGLAEMLWANLMLPFTDNIAALLDNWAQALQTDGLLFFSHWGADSAPELRDILQRQKIACALPVLLDMHDLGDLLPEHHFYDPIVDTAKLVLTYTDATSLWHDLETLGVWQALRPHDLAAAKAAAEQAWTRGALREITLEVLQVHALKKNMLPANENPVRFYPRGKI